MLYHSCKSAPIFITLFQHLIKFFVAWWWLAISVERWLKHWSWVLQNCSSSRFHSYSIYLLLLTVVKWELSKWIIRAIVNQMYTRLTIKCDSCQARNETVLVSNVQQVFGSRLETQTLLFSESTQMGEARRELDGGHKNKLFINSNSKKYIYIHYFLVCGWLTYLNLGIIYKKTDWVHGIFWFQNSILIWIHYLN